MRVLVKPEADRVLWLHASKSMQNSGSGALASEPPERSPSDRSAHALNTDDRLSCMAGSMQSSVTLQRDRSADPRVRCRRRVRTTARDAGADAERTGSESDAGNRKGNA